MKKKVDKGLISSGFGCRFHQARGLRQSLVANFAEAEEASQSEEELVQNLSMEDELPIQRSDIQTSNAFEVADDDKQVATFEPFRDPTEQHIETVSTVEESQHVPEVLNSPGLDSEDKFENLKRQSQADRSTGSELEAVYQQQTESQSESANGCIIEEDQYQQASHLNEERVHPDTPSVSALDQRDSELEKTEQKGQDLLIVDSSGKTQKAADVISSMPAEEESIDCTMRLPDTVLFSNSHEDNMTADKTETSPMVFPWNRETSPSRHSLASPQSIYPKKEVELFAEPLSASKESFVLHQDSHLESKKLQRCQSFEIEDTAEDVEDALEEQLEALSLDHDSVVETVDQRKFDDSVTDNGESSHLQKRNEEEQGKTVVSDMGSHSELQSSVPYEATTGQETQKTDFRHLDLNSDNVVNTQNIQIDKSMERQAIDSDMRELGADCTAQNIDTSAVTEDFTVKTRPNIIQNQLRLSLATEQLLGSLTVPSLNENTSTRYKTPILGPDTLDIEKTNMFASRPSPQSLRSRYTSVTADRGNSTIQTPESHVRSIQSKITPQLTPKVAKLSSDASSSKSSSSVRSTRSTPSTERLTKEASSSKDKTSPPKSASRSGREVKSQMKSAPAARVTPVVKLKTTVARSAPASEVNRPRAAQKESSTQNPETKKTTRIPPPASRLPKPTMMQNRSHRYATSSEVR